MVKKGGGKKFRQGVARERNWTDLETQVFCTILADPEFSFSYTLESRALKKQANKEIFEDIMSQLKTAFEDFIRILLLLSELFFIRIPRLRLAKY